MNCSEETRLDDRRVESCLAEAVPGLPHCAQHARIRLAEARDAFERTHARLRERLDSLLDAELQLEALKREQQSDRGTWQSLRSSISIMEDALRAEPPP